MTDLSHYDRDDPGFVGDLRASQKHVQIIAEWLRAKGLTVDILPTRIRPDVHQMSDYADDGDILVSKDGGQKYRVEVKQRKLRFTSIDDFPYSSIIVDVAHTWDRADPKPAAYILTNIDITAAIVIKAKTSDQWVRTQKWDRFKKRNRTFLECPVSLGECHVIEGL